MGKKNLFPAIGDAAYRKHVGRRPSHGHRQHAQKLLKIARMQRYPGRQTDRQTHRHTHHNTSNRSRERTSGKRNLTKDRIAAAHGRFSGIRQVAPECTPPNTCFLPTTRVQIALYQTASRAVQPFFVGLTTMTDGPTDRPTDHATRPVTIGSIYVRTTAMRPNNNK